MAKIMDIVTTANSGDTITLVTHEGKFHSDDVLATVILTEFFKQLGFATNVVRTFNPKEQGYTDETPNCVVYDIGLGMYDHHQVGEDASHCIRLDEVKNEDGEVIDTIERKYAAVGLIWKEIGEQWLGAKYADIIYNTIIRYVDDHDNGFGANPLSTLISHMNPNFATPSAFQFNAHFKICCDVVSAMFIETLNHYVYIQQCERFLLDAVENSNGCCLVTDLYLPGADDICRERGIPFYVYPNMRKEGEYCFKTITSTPDVTSDKICNIPDEVREWKGVTFLHPSCFLGSAVNKQRAIEICHLINDNN